MKEEIKQRCDVAFKTNDEVDELSQRSVSTLMAHASPHTGTAREARKKSKFDHSHQHHHHGQPTEVQK